MIDTPSAPAAEPGKSAVCDTCGWSGDMLCPDCKHPVRTRRAPPAAAPAEVEALALAMVNAERGQSGLPPLDDTRLLQRGAVYGAFPLYARVALSRLGGAGDGALRPAIIQAMRDHFDARPPNFDGEWEDGAGDAADAILALLRARPASAPDAEDVAALVEWASKALEYAGRGEPPDARAWADELVGLAAALEPFKSGHRVLGRAPDAETERLRETQATINQWTEDTFGPVGSNLSVAARANREMSELIQALTADDNHPGAAEEVADIVIILYRLAQRLGVVLSEAVDRKMAVNRKRDWRLDGHGNGQHVATPAAAPGVQR